jgi:hypothetical protein
MNNKPARYDVTREPTLTTSDGTRPRPPLSSADGGDFSLKHSLPSEYVVTTAAAGIRFGANDMKPYPVGGTSDGGAR